jgi:hypothetical protein
MVRLDWTELNASYDREASAISQLLLVLERLFMNNGKHAEQKML